MNRITDAAMTTAAITFLTGLLTPWHWALAAAIALCALGLWADPETRHQRARQHRREERAASWQEDAIRGRHRAESDLLWDEFDAGERMPGLDEDRKWNG